MNNNETPTTTTPYRTKRVVWGNYRVVCRSKHEGVKCHREQGHEGDHEGIIPVGIIDRVDVRWVRR